MDNVKTAGRQLLASVVGVAIVVVVILCVVPIPLNIIFGGAILIRSYHYIWMPLVNKANGEE